MGKVGRAAYAVVDERVREAAAAAQAHEVRREAMLRAMPAIVAEVGLGFLRHRRQSFKE